MSPEQLAAHWHWSTAVPLIPALPALAFLIGILFGGRGLGHRTPYVTIAAMLTSTVLAWVFVFLPVLSHFLQAHEPLAWTQNWPWAHAGDSVIAVGVMVDHLTAAMLAMVTLIVLMIEVYSVGYMKGDPHYPRFHSYVSLFAAGMLGLVVSNNYLTLLMSWEVMGLCSYLLIGFWYHKDSAKRAAKKAFMVTRLGDLGMLLGIMLAFTYAHSFGFHEIFTWAAGAPALLVCLVAIGLFMGSVGKSAQFPLHVWLPDAMEGPTPVSALIHAATMVSAGVYLVARSYPLFYGPDGHIQAAVTLTGGGFSVTVNPMLTVAWIGGFTSLFAATMAVFAADIKKVLAYSTISQLGYMFLALGVGGYTAGVFHLLTHAFFKALLFLGSGSVIHAVEHAMHHEHVHEDPQALRNMGGLAKRMPVTYVTFLLGTLALAGIFPFAGFFSKDEILLEVFRGYHAHAMLGGFGVAAAFLTAFYMTRLMMLAFYGQPRFPKVWEHTEDSPPVMTMPLCVLAVFAVCLGWPALPGLFGGQNYFHHFINLEALRAYGLTAPEPTHADLTIVFGSLSVAILGILAGYWCYGRPAGARLRQAAWANPLSRGLMTAPKRLYWMDDLLYALFVRPTFALMRACYVVDQWVIDLTVKAVGWLGLALAAVGRWLDQNFIDKVLVNGPAVGSRTVGEVGKLLQTGRVQGYAVVAISGLLLLVVVRMFMLR